MRKLYLTLLVITFQFLIIFGLAYTNQVVIDEGIEMHLKLAPVDPRDPFRGDYVILNYEDSEVTYSYYSESAQNQEPRVGRDVYVSFSNYGNSYKSWTQSRVYLDKNNIYDSKNVVYLKGVIRSVVRTDSQGDCDDCYRNYKLRVEYGIEEYFIEEESGWDLPDFSNGYGVVFVDRNSGKAVLKEVEVDGKKWP